MLGKRGFERDIQGDHQTVLYGQHQYTLIPFVFLATVDFDYESFRYQYTLTTLALLCEKFLNRNDDFRLVCAAFLLHLKLATLRLQQFVLFFFIYDFMSPEFCHIDLPWVSVFFVRLNEFVDVLL